MFRMIVIGFFSFIGISLFALQGMATWKQQDNYKKGVLGTVELYKSMPFEAQRLTKLAAQTCLEDRAGGKLPSYFTDFMADSVAAAFSYAAENDFESSEDPAVQNFVSEMKTSMTGRIDEIAQRIAREPESLKRRLNTAMDWVNGNRKSAASCVGLNVMRQAAAEQDAPPS